MAWHPTGIPTDGEIPPGPRGLRLGGQDLVVVGSAGGWYAVEDRCSHAGCAFSEDGEVEAGRLVCNCHGSEFDVRTGEPLRGPASRPIRTFPTRVTDGIVEIEL